MGVYWFKKKSPVNKVGFYTKEQVDELLERTEILWNQLNEAQAYMHSDAQSIRGLTGPDGILDTEERAEMIRKRCDELIKCADRCSDVLTHN